MNTIDAPAGQPFLQELYALRFGPQERAKLNAVWKVLCQSFFQRYVSQSDVVVDLGAGYCQFINNIRCGRKVAVDLREETRQCAGQDVTVLLQPARDLCSLEDASVDVVFASNFLEHLPSKQEFMATLAEIHRILHSGGKLLILQPNIRCSYKEYWDYLDHYLPLSHLSLAEALQLAGFLVQEVRPQFLPYTVKSRLPYGGILLRFYLRLPLLHLLLGRQMFLVAAKTNSC